jgi:hypothetical protein
MRNLDTVNNDGRVLREKGVDGAGEVLGPFSEGRKYDGIRRGC